MKNDPLNRKYFSGRYIDRKVMQPAIAACVPLKLDHYVHDPTRDSLTDENGFLGVACMGILFRHLSTFVKDVWPSEEYEHTLAYITNEAGWCRMT